MNVTTSSFAASAETRRAAHRSALLAQAFRRAVPCAPKMSRADHPSSLDDSALIGLGFTGGASRYDA